MRQTINYELTYFRKGVEFKKVIPIKFVSNRVYDLYADVAEKANRLQVLMEKQKKALEDFGWTATNKDYSFRDRKDKVKPIKEELQEIHKEIKSIDSNVFLKERFRLIEKILEDNGVTDEELLDIGFWDNHVEPIEVWGFLSAAVTKDATGKKKAIT